MNALSAKKNFYSGWRKIPFRTSENSALNKNYRIITRPYLEPPRADDASRVVVEPEAEDSVAELG